MTKIIATLAVLMVTSTVHAAVFNCIGTEPFWTAQINTTAQVTKLQLNESQGATISTKITQAAGTTGDYAFTAEGKYVTLSVVTDATCNDGMSDKTYTHAVLLKRAGTSPLYGCCRQ
jgi:uncharacterized membrane protein